MNLGSFGEAHAHVSSMPGAQEVTGPKSKAIKDAQESGAGGDGSKV